MDLSTVEEIDAFSYVYIVCLVDNAMRKLGLIQHLMDPLLSPPLQLILPEHSDFFKDSLLYPCQNADELFVDRTYVVNHDQDIQEIGDLVNSLIIDEKIGIDLQGLNENLPEILHNAKVHSVEPFYLFRCHFSVTNKYFDTVIADIGLGIKGTLSKKAEYSYLKDKPSMHSIIKAFEPMVTSRNEPRGTGLSEAHDYVIEHSESTMFLSSNDGYYLIEHEDGAEVINAGNLRYNLNGVQILLRFGCE